MDEDEKYLREKWGGFAVLDDTTTMERGIGVFLGHGVSTLWGFASYEDAIRAARAFTEQRQEEIRQTRNEVATMRDMREFILSMIESHGVDLVEATRDLCCNCRTLARAEAALDALLVGTKGM